MVLNASDAPNLNNVTSTSYMFYDCRNLNQDIGFWDVSNITESRFMFWRCIRFNQDLSGWDVSQVTDMSCELERTHQAVSFSFRLGRPLTSAPIVDCRHVLF